MNDTVKEGIPRWLWAVLALAVVGVTLLLFATDRRPEPGPALVYDVSKYESVDPAQLCYREAARIPLDLREPTGLAVAGDGRILVTGDSTLLALNASGEELSRRDFGRELQCIAAAPDGAVFLGTRDTVILLPSVDGAPETWKPLGEEAWLTSLAANETHLYAADSGNARVLHYDRTGRLVRQMGGKGEAGEGPKFIVPSHYFDLAFDRMGSLWVVNPGKLGLENYREDGSLLSVWHQPGMDVKSFCGCCNPIHIAFLNGNVLAAAEKGINRVKVLAADRSFLGLVAPPERINEGWTPSDEAYAPAPVRDLAVDDRDRILVLHGPLHCILVFEESPHKKESP